MRRGESIVRLKQKSFSIFFRLFHFKDNEKRNILDAGNDKGW